MPEDPRRVAPAVARNRDPLLAVLRRVLPARGTVLEVASGSGEHAVYVAPRLPGIVWQPTDPDPEALRSIAAWTAEARVDSVLPPIALDAAMDPWPVTRADALVCINMVHIAPWSACEGLFRGAGRILPAGAPVVLYGPFVRDGAHTAPSNADFDRGLRARDPRWGVRDLADVTRVAESTGFCLDEIVAMPANNLTVVYRRVADTA